MIVHEHVGAVMCVYAVRVDAGGFGWAQRELNARCHTDTGCQRPAAQIYAHCLRHADSRRDRTLPTFPYTGFCFVLF